MGNPTSYLGANLTWQGKQLKSHTTTNGYMTTVLHFAYDENGLRTEKGFASNKTYYYYNGTVLIGMQKGNVTQRFSYDASGKVVSVNYNGTDYYYLRNAQGDIVKLIDNNSNTVVEYTYDSWGKILATTGSLANTVGTNQPFRYRGYVYDNETGWYYLQTRYYDPSTCRFISSDVYLSTGQGVLGHNSYAYCLNNPINMADDSGCRPVDITVSSGSGTGYSSHDSLEEALICAGIRLSYLSQKDGREHAYIIHKKDDRYYFGGVINGEHDRITVSMTDEQRQTAVAVIHSHPYCTGHFGNRFSLEDKKYATANEIPVYLAAPNGDIYGFTSVKVEDFSKKLSGVIPKNTSMFFCLGGVITITRSGSRHLTLAHMTDVIN